MDRFIDSALKNKIEAIEHLKSNMDRFIEMCRGFRKQSCRYLKSNMDRFIGSRTENYLAEKQI